MILSDCLYDLQQFMMFLQAPLFSKPFLPHQKKMIMLVIKYFHFHPVIGGDFRQPLKILNRYLSQLLDLDCRLSNRLKRILFINYYTFLWAKS